MRTLCSNGRSLSQVTVGAQVTWVLSAAETLLCSMASGSIFFLIARLLTVMVSAFTDYRNIKGTHENSSLDTTPLHRQQERRRRKLSSNPTEKYVKAGLVSLRKDPKRAKAIACMRRVRPHASGLHVF